LLTGFHREGVWAMAGQFQSAEETRQGQTDAYEGGSGSGP